MHPLVFLCAVVAPLEVPNDNPRSLGSQRSARRLRSRTRRNDWLNLKLAEWTRLVPGMFCRFFSCLYFVIYYDLMEVKIHLEYIWARVVRFHAIAWGVQGNSLKG